MIFVIVCHLHVFKQSKNLSQFFLTVLSRYCMDIFIQVFIDNVFLLTTMKNIDLHFTTHGIPQGYPLKSFVIYRLKPCLPGPNPYSKEFNNFRLTPSICWLHSAPWPVLQYPFSYSPVNISAIQLGFYFDHFSDPRNGILKVNYALKSKFISNSKEMPHFKRNRE